MNKVMIIGLMFSFLFGACQVGGSQDKENLQEDLRLASRMPAIDKSMILPQYLVEISGLTFDASANMLIGHDDELAILYFIDFEAGKIESKLKIGNIGDYEGVELVDDHVYLINSQGDILDHRLGEQGSKKIKTVFTAENNIEGLCYYEDQLLIACKGKPEVMDSQKFSGSRGVYSYSLSKGELDSWPFMMLSYANLKSFFPGEISKTLDERLKAFAPSGIAIHPVTGEFYILSFKGGLMLVCNEAGEINKIYLLDKEAHRQPEGICFDKQNRLYIANEGRKSKPVIHRYQF